MCVCMDLVGRVGIKPQGCILMNAPLCFAFASFVKLGSLDYFAVTYDVDALLHLLYTATLEVVDEF